MKINKQTLFSIIFICFALIGKSMSHDKPTTETPSSSPTTETPSSSPTTETPSSLPTTETPSSLPTTETPSSLPMTETPSSLPTTETPSSLPTTETPSSLPTTETPSSLPTTETPSSSSPASSPSSSPSDEVSDTSSTSDSPSSSIDPPSDSPAPTPDSDASGDSSSTSASFSDILKEKYGDQSKTEYSPILQKICGHTHHIDVCLATISALIKNKKKFDVVQVLEASIKVSKENIKAIVEKIEENAKESRENAASLNDCKEHYSKALDSLHKSLEAIRAKNFGKVTILLSGALADVSTAESKVVDLQIPNFKVESFSFASVTASNCLSIASLVPN